MQNCEQLCSSAHVSQRMKQALLVDYINRYTTFCPLPLLPAPYTSSTPNVLFPDFLANRIIATLCFNSEIERLNKFNTQIPSFSSNDPHSSLFILNSHFTTYSYFIQIIVFQNFCCSFFHQLSSHFLSRRKNWLRSSSTIMFFKALFFSSPIVLAAIELSHVFVRILTTEIQFQWKMFILTTFFSFTKFVCQ